MKGVRIKTDNSDVVQTAVGVPFTKGFFAEQEDAPLATKIKGALDNPQVKCIVNDARNTTFIWNVTRFLHNITSQYLWAYEARLPRKSALQRIHPVPTDDAVLRPFRTLFRAARNCRDDGTHTCRSDSSIWPTPLKMQLPQRRLVQDHNRSGTSWCVRKPRQKWTIPEDDRHI